MGRAPCCDKSKVKRGPWSPEEDSALKSYVQAHGTGGNWISLPLKAGLNRCGKSCRLRWLNYLRPDIKHGGFTEEENTIICNLYKSIGSRWSVIASQLQGRTDNDVKNYWNTKLKKKYLLTEETNSANITTSSSRSSSSSSSSPNLLTQHDQFNNYTFSHSINVGLEHFENHSQSQRLVSNPTLQYNQMFTSFEATLNSPNNYVTSSSSIGLDENCFLLAGNGVCEDKSNCSMAGFGHNSCFDVNGFFGFHERASIDANASLANSVYDNLCFDDYPSDVKPQCLYQSITNYEFSSLYK
ncbi:hypothetical protein Sjap_019504 [Stephania japonica]|uniref:Uncharacterized protein n=1 Tax=Stephania japonica TaxID=461633 RepID=A0AAP0EYX0_9MAGN